MANNITIRRVDGGVLCPSATWRSRTRVKNNFTQITTLIGSGPAFGLNSELQKLDGVLTQYGIYQDHTIKDGGDDIYDQITINFQALLNPPQYTYDFNSPTKSFPLSKHPSYRAFWDNDIVDKNGGTNPTSLSVLELEVWQSQTVPEPASGGSKGLTWVKNNGAKPSSGSVCVTNALTSQLTTAWPKCSAKKPGVNSYIFPAISVRETIYFVEERDYTFKSGPPLISQAFLNTKTVASMGGKAGWPLRATFGYPRDVYSLLNDSGGDYSDYRKIGVDKDGNTVNLQESFYEQRGIPLDSYIHSSSIGEYNGALFGHPLWICTSCVLKKVGYWYEATLQWEYYGFGVDSDLYPVSEARTLGLA